MNSHLFVYGSLMTALAHPMGARLRAEATLVGPATIAGRLYRVSWYPGLRPAVTPTDIVHGELYRLSDPAMTLVWLDEYEGITRGAISVTLPDEYQRAEAPITCSDGTGLTAWVYVHQRPIDAAALIPDGRWRG